MVAILLAAGAGSHLANLPIDAYVTTALAAGPDVGHRVDSADPWQYGRFDSWRATQNAPYFAELLRTMPRRTLLDGQRRIDSWSAEGGLFMARQLEQILKKVLETPYPENNLLKFFPISTEVRPGAKTYTIRRFKATGTARIWGGGDSVPRVELTQDEETWNVRHIVSSFVLDMFEMMASNFADIDVAARKMNATREACAQLFNRLGWFGNKAAKLYGVLDYPYLQKTTSVVPFDGTASPEDVAAELFRVANYAKLRSNSVFRSDAMIVTDEIDTYISETRMTGTNSDHTIKSWFLAHNTAGIKEIGTAWELKSSADTTSPIPDGCHAILCYRKANPDAVCVQVVQPFTPLPMQKRDFEDVTNCYQSTGGINMYDMGNNVLMYVEIADAA